MHHRRAAFAILAALFLAGCPNGSGPVITPQTTLAGKSVGTLWKSSGTGNLGPGCTPATPPRPDPRGWYGGLPQANRDFGFAGFESWRNSNAGCTNSALDVYRTLVTFNTGALSNLKGLVQKAELIVNTQALPAGAGRVVTLPSTPPVNIVCPAALGGGGSLRRFGPAEAASLPALSAASTALIEYPGTTPFPNGGLVYTFPASLTPGPVAGAANPTSVTASGTGGVSFTTDVTSQVQAALNGGMPGMSWMLTSVFEGPLPSIVPNGGQIDCKTSYDIQLRITHL